MNWHKYIESLEHYKDLQRDRTDLPANWQTFDKWRSLLNIICCISGIIWEHLSAVARWHIHEHTVNIFYLLGLQIPIMVLSNIIKFWMRQTNTDKINKTVIETLENRIAHTWTNRLSCVLWEIRMVCFCVCGLGILSFSRHRCDYPSQKHSGFAVNAR